MTKTASPGQRKIVDRPGEPGYDATAEAELAYRLHQQELLSEFGLFALRCTSLDETMHQATVTGAEGLNVELCKFLQYREIEDDLYMRAGVGWDDGTVGNASLAADLASPAGYAYQSGQPVLSNHLETEKRFRTPPLLVDHGVQRAINVPVRDGGTPHGVLEADSRNCDTFTQADIAFLQGIANILSVVIERDNRRSELNEAMERERLLGGEMRHRVKNLFAIVNSLISLSKREAATKGDPGHALTLLTERVAALARASEAGLAEADRERTSGRKRFDPVETANLVLKPYGERIVASAQTPFQIEFDLTTLALLIHELATNAVKHGSLSAEKGSVRMIWSQSADEEVTFVWTEQGGPRISEAPQREGFGLNLIGRLLKPLGGDIGYEWKPDGLVATVRFR